MLPKPGTAPRALAVIAAGVTVGPVGMALAPWILPMLPEKLQEAGHGLMDSAVDIAKGVAPRFVYDELKAAMTAARREPYAALVHEALAEALRELGQRPEYGSHLAWIERWIGQLATPLPMSSASMDALLELPHSRTDPDGDDGWPTVLALLTDADAAARMPNGSIVMRPISIAPGLVGNLKRDLPPLLTTAIQARLHDSRYEAAFRNAVLTSVARVGERLAEAQQDGRIALSSVLVPLWNLPETMPFHFAGLDAALLFGTAPRTVDDDLPRFLESKGDIRWWLWTGLEGSGKSRLAASACRAAIARGWHAGFLTGDVREDLANETSRPVSFERDTLIVVDDIGYRPAHVRSILKRLPVRRGEGRVRVILLGRHSGSLQPGPQTPDLDLPSWYLEIFRPPLEGVPDRGLLDSQFPSAGAASFYVPDFTPEEAREFAERCAVTSGAGVRAASVAARAVALLTPPDRPAQTRPLHIQLTVRVLVSAADDGPESFEQAVRRYIEGRVRYRQQRLRDKLPPGEVERALNLMCVATLLGKVDLESLPASADLPSARSAARRQALLDGFEQPLRASMLQGLEPDLIGEWFVLLWCGGSVDFNGGLTVDRLDAILDSLPESTSPVADFVQRTFRYFSEQPLWRRLSRRIGRYATPFGRLFDQPRLQLELLRGTAHEAAQWYTEEVESALRDLLSRRSDSITVVDLMAGGADFLRQLFRGVDTSRLQVLAIDRDTTRLQTLAEDLEQQFGAQGHSIPLHVVRAHVSGRLGLGELLIRHCGEPTCDLLIARKALHEIGWDSQATLITEIGDTVDPVHGRVIVYADAPDEISPADRVRIGRHRALLRSADRASASSDSREALIRKLTAGSFEPRASDAAVFANFWIRLKDWANYNDHEFENRYFSSANELQAAFAAAGLIGASRRFTMRLAPTRFIEEPINRLGYLCSDPDVSTAELASVVAASPRHEVFRRVTDTLLWADREPTPFGAFMRAEEEPPVDLRALVKGLGDRASRLQTVHFPAWTTTSFEMPVHVFTLGRRRA